MIVAVIVDDDAFVNALRLAQTDFTNSLLILENIVLLSLTARISVKNFPQSFSLKEIESKKKQSEKRIMNCKEKQISELLSKKTTFTERVFHRNFITVFIENSFDLELRNTMKVFTENISFINYTTLIDLNNDSMIHSILTYNTFKHYWTRPNVRNTFIQVSLNEEMKAFMTDDAKCAMPFINDVVYSDESQDSKENEMICLVTNNATVHSNVWILDSDANVYICNNVVYFKDLYTFSITVNTVN